MKRINKKGKKVIIFVLTLCAILFSTYLVAQNQYYGSKGLFGYAPDKNYENRDNESFIIANEDFELPIGNGIIILLSAGIGYLTFKKKEDQP